MPRVFVVRRGKPILANEDIDSIREELDSTQIAPVHRKLGERMQVTGINYLGFHSEARP